MPPRLQGHLWTGDSPGARHRQARIAKGMTINDLAAAAGLSAVAISKLEAGKTVAALKNLRKFSSHFRAAATEPKAVIEGGACNGLFAIVGNSFCNFVPFLLCNKLSGRKTTPAICQT